MTADLATVDRFFHAETDLDPESAQKQVKESLSGMDDGELYLEYVQSEFFSWDDGQLQSCSYDTDSGFGLRAVAGETFGYAHAAELSQAALSRAAGTVRAVKDGYSGTLDLAPRRTNVRLYGEDNPLAGIPFAEKVALLQKIDAYARNKDSRVRQVSAQLAASWKIVKIIRPDGETRTDIRPLVRLSVSVYLGNGQRMEDGYHGLGGRYGYEALFQEETWKAAVDEAFRQAEVNLASVAAPAGEMTVVLGAGWPGILLHEAIGHGLEGDFNRKGTSAFSGLMGQQVAAKGVTVVDDGTLENRRGSLTIDDEGTPTGRTVLIEDGILTGYLQDRMNARLMGGISTGNGRRESYAAPVLPRMTNTVMLAGEAPPEEILRSVKRGLYAVNFGGGQVDITSGKFVFSASEAYLIEDGRIGPAVKGATLIGHGPDCLTRVGMIGNDMQLDPGIGTCGKEGQSVPVGVGQPTLRIDGLTVGGTGA